MHYPIDDECNECGVLVTEADKERMRDALYSAALPLTFATSTLCEACEEKRQASE